MQLVSLYPGVKMEPISAEMGWQVRVANTLYETPVPSAEELAILRKLNAGSTGASEG